MKNKFLLLATLMLIFSSTCYALAKSPKKSVVVYSGGENENSRSLSNSSKNFRRIRLQERLLAKAWGLVKQGDYDKAILKYEEAMQPEYLNRKKDKLGALFPLMKVYQLQNNYSMVFEMGEEIFAVKESHVYAHEKKQEVQAQVEGVNIKSNGPIYKHINYLMTKYEKSLPPKAYNSFSPVPVGTIIRLYDYMGDYKNGIAFVDRVLNYKHNQFTRPEYEKVRQAFIESQQGMPEICGDGGKTCIGRATHVLIQSDKLSW